MSPHADNNFVAEINVTPFVDVMLVLLIIFMITAPMMTEGLEVNLPQLKTSQTIPTEEDKLTLTVKHDGSIFVEDKAIELSELKAFLAENVLSDNKQLFLKADKSLEYGLVMEIMGQIRAQGISNIGMITQSLDQSSGQNSEQSSEQNSGQNSEGN